MRLRVNQSGGRAGITYVGNPNVQPFIYLLSPTRFQPRTAQLCPERQIVADSGRGADVDPRRPTSSLEKDQLSPKTYRFS